MLSVACKQVITLARLGAARATPALLHIGQADPLRRQGADIVVHVKVLDLNLATVDHVDNVLDGDGRLSNVCGNDDLARALRRPGKDGLLVDGGHEAVQREDGGRVEAVMASAVK